MLSSEASTYVIISTLSGFITKTKSPGSMAPNEPSSVCFIEPDSTTTIGGNIPVASHIEPSNRNTKPIARNASLKYNLIASDNTNPPYYQTA